MTACNVADGLQRDISNLQLYVYRVFDVREVQELEHSDRDTDSFFKVMWKGLRDVLQVSVTSQMSSALGARGGQGGGIADNSLSGVEFVNHLIKSIRRVKETKRLMKEIWEQVGLSVQGRLDVYILWLQLFSVLIICNMWQSKDYRISDRVHMTEIQILQRLKNDGVFPYLDRNTSSSTAKNGKMGMQNIHLCFFMRRQVTHLGMQNIHLCLFMRRQVAFFDLPKPFPFPDRIWSADLLHSGTPLQPLWASGSTQRD